VQEFDRPRRGWPTWLTWLVVVVAVLVGVVVLAGFAGGVGPLRVLGTTTTSLDAVAYRTTARPDVIEIGVTLPPDGLCRDDELKAIAFERSNRVEVQTSVTRPRTGTCAVTSVGGDIRWVETTLGAPLGSRTVIRETDRQPLAREQAG
jgi:hypothetical protein